MRKKIFALIMAGIIGLSVPAWCQSDVFDQKEKREDGTFDITADEVIAFSGFNSMEWSDKWIPIVGLMPDNSFIGLFEPQDNPNFEELYVYVVPFSPTIDTRELQDILIGSVTSGTRRDAGESAQEYDVSTPDRTAKLYVYSVNGTTYYDYSTNSGTAIVDFVYSAPSTVGESENKSAYTEMLDSINADSTQEDSAPVEPTNEQAAAPELQHYEVNLGAGYYTIGKDIPAGTYYISMISGLGNVYCSPSLNEIFGSDYGIKEYNNFKAVAGKILTVSGNVVLYLSSDNADLANMTPRTVLETYNWWEMSAGTYTVGIDIPAGLYYVTVVGGNGNASILDFSHDDGGLNEIFAVDEGYRGITSFNNLYLYEGNVLEISGTTRLHFDQIGE